MYLDSSNKVIKHYSPSCFKLPFTQSHPEFILVTHIHLARSVSRSAVHPRCTFNKP